MLYSLIDYCNIESVLNLPTKIIIGCLNNWMKCCCEIGYLHGYEVSPHRQFTNYKEENVSLKWRAVVDISSPR